MGMVACQPIPPKRRDPVLIEPSTSPVVDPKVETKTVEPVPNEVKQNSDIVSCTEKDLTACPLNNPLIKAEVEKCRATGATHCESKEFIASIEKQLAVAPVVAPKQVETTKTEETAPKVGPCSTPTLYVKTTDPASCLLLRQDKNIKSGPCIDYGEPLEFIEGDSEWGKVTYKGQTGFVSLAFISCTKPTAPSTSMALAGSQSMNLVGDSSEGETPRIRKKQCAVLSKLTKPTGPFEVRANEECSKGWPETFRNCSSKASAKSGYLSCECTMHFYEYSEEVLNCDECLVKQKEKKACQWTGVYLD
jgi:hypothetical protein